MRVQTSGLSLLLLAVTSSCLAQQPYDSLDRQMFAIVSDREEKAKDINAMLRKTEQGSLYGGILEEPTALLIAYHASTVNHAGGSKKTAIGQIRHLLGSSDPKLVGIGCQIADASGSLDLLPDLARLLDKLEVGPHVQIPSMSQMMIPKADQKYYYAIPTVGKLAQNALLSITNIVFNNENEFNIWMSDWANRKQRIWYWKAKWQRLAGVRFGSLQRKKLIPRLPMLANEAGLIGMWSNETKQSYYGKPRVKAPIIRQPFFKFDSEFKFSDKAASLNILVQLDNHLASQNEAQSIIGSKPVYVDSSVYFDNPGLNSVYIDSEVLAEYVRANKLQAKLLSYLDRENDTKSTALTGYDQRERLYRAAGKCIDEKFSQVIGRIAESWIDSSHIWQQTVVLQSRVDPKRAIDILDAALAKNPSSPLVLAELVGRAPGTRISELITSYSKLSKHEASSFLLYLWSESSKGNTIPSGFIKGLLELRGEPLQVFPEHSLAYLAECLNKTLGRQAVSQSIIDVARYGRQIGKGGGERPAAFEEAANAKLKEAMLAALASEKTY